MHTDQHSIVSWLIAQQQMLSIWLDEISQQPGEVNPKLVYRLEEHERWLARSISELTAV